MSDYISGQEIVDEYEIRSFEILNRFIHNDLFPLGPQSGQPVEVRQFLIFALNIQEIDDEDPRLEHYQGIIEANNETTWNKFQLPGDDEIDQKINEALLEHIYDKKQYKKLEALDQMQRHGHPEPPPGIMAKPAMAAKVEPSNRLSKEHKEICRERARQIWEAHPDMHPAELVTYTAFQLRIIKKNGDMYSPVTLHKWIKDLWPNRYLGPAKDLNIPPAIIDNLLQN